jgi:hypothetical protein
MIPGFYRYNDFVFEVIRGKWSLFGRRRPTIRSGACALSEKAAQVIYELSPMDLHKLDTVVSVVAGEKLRIKRRDLTIEGEVVKTHAALEFKPEWIHAQTALTSASDIWRHFSFADDPNQHMVTALDVLLALNDSVVAEARVAGTRMIGTADDFLHEALVTKARQWAAEMTEFDDGKSYMVTGLPAQQLDEWILDVSENLVEFAKQHKDLL